MKRMRTLQQTDGSPSTVGEDPRAGGSDRRARNRRRAVTYLAAAVREENAWERKDLRRRAAELILSSPLTTGPCNGARPAC